MPTLGQEVEKIEEKKSETITQAAEGPAQPVATPTGKKRRTFGQKVERGLAVVGALSMLAGLGGAGGAGYGLSQSITMIGKNESGVIVYRPTGDYSIIGPQAYQLVTPENNSDLPDISAALEPAVEAIGGLIGKINDGAGKGFIAGVNGALDKLDEATTQRTVFVFPFAGSYVDERIKAGPAYAITLNSPAEPAANGAGLNGIDNVTLCFAGLPSDDTLQGVTLGAYVIVDPSSGQAVAALKTDFPGLQKMFNQNACYLYTKMVQDKMADVAGVQTPMGVDMDVKVDGVEISNPDVYAQIVALMSQGQFNSPYEVGEAVKAAGMDASAYQNATRLDIVENGFMLDGTGGINGAFSRYDETEYSVSALNALLQSMDPSYNPQDLEKMAQGDFNFEPSDLIQKIADTHQTTFQVLMAAVSGQAMVALGTLDPATGLAPYSIAGNPNGPMLDQLTLVQILKAATVDYIYQTKGEDAAWAALEMLTAKSVESLEDPAAQSAIAKEFLDIYGNLGASDEQMFLDYAKATMQVDSKELPIVMYNIDAEAIHHHVYHANEGNPQGSP